MPRRRPGHDAVAARISVSFVEPSGRVHDATVEPGRTLLDAARSVAAPGIVAECGGNGVCGTCHVYVDPQWLSLLGAPTGDERDLLACVWRPAASSRLSCQIRLSIELDGLRVRVPELQR